MKLRAEQIKKSMADRNYGFENMNEFYLSYKESKGAYAYYQHKVEDWKRLYCSAKSTMNKAEMMSEKLTRLQKEVETSRIYDKKIKDRGAR